MEAVSKEKERVAKASPTGFSGNLAIVPIMDVLEKVRNQGETGLLSVWTPMVKGTVWVRKGETVDAEVGVRRGIAALDLLGLLGDGSFVFEGCETVDRKITIELSSSEVVRRWKAMEDACRAQLNKLPPLLDQVFWDNTREPFAAADTDERRAILSRLRQGCTLLEVLVEVDQDIDAALATLVAASETFNKKESSTVDNTQPHNDRESPRPVWTAPPPVARTKSLGSDGFVGTLGGHHPSANPKRRILVPPVLPAAPENNGPEVPGPSVPAAAATAQKPVASRWGARTLLGVPMGEVIEARASAPGLEPLDGIVGEMIEAAPETIRTSAPPPAERNSAGAHTGLNTTVLAGSLPLASPAESAPVAEPRVIPRAKWDGRRHVGGLLELGGRKLEKVRTLASGRFVCELVEETQGLDTAHWALKMPARPMPDACLALQNEVRHLSQCRHHAIVEYGAAGMDVDIPYLLTHYHPSLTLTALGERQGKLPFGVIAGIAKQVLQGLVYLHDTARPQGGLTHGNLCPDNVLVGFDGVVKVSGLSSARRLTDAHVDGDVRVQARYSSPELLRGETYDGRADVFSVGAILRFLGERADVKHAPLAERIVARALDADLNVRYPNAAQMLLEMGDLPGVYSVRELGEWMARSGLAEAEGAELATGTPLAEVKRTKEDHSNKSHRLRIILVGVALVFAVVALLVFSMKG